MPRLGESIEEGTVVRWLKTLGSSVDLDEALVEISTDKVDSEIPSPVAGVLTHVEVQEGETVPVGAVLGIIEPSLEIKLGRNEPEPTVSVIERGVDGAIERPDDVTGGGMEDTPPEADLVHSEHPPTLHSDRVSPAVRWMSSVLAIDPSTIDGSGTGGRVTRRDLEATAHSRSNPQSGGEQVTGNAFASTKEESSTRHPTEIRGGTPLSPIRRVISANLRRSIGTAVHALVSVTVDYGAIDTARRVARLRNERLTYLPFIAYSALRSISNFPLVSSRMLSDDVVDSGEPVHLGIAVDVNHAGLRVPVIRNASALTLLALAQEIGAATEAVVAGALKPGDLEGGTFTISNVGTYGTTFSIPIINYPQVAILCVDGIRPTPIALAEDGGSHSIGIRSVGSLSLSFDHRIFDGAYAAAYLAQVRERLETYESVEGAWQA